MLFALIDLVQYQHRGGRFARYAPSSEMGAAFLGGLPTAAVDLLQPADMLFTSQYGSLIAWAIMYLTSSEVNHVAIYVGSGQIAHATPGCLVVDRIEVLYDPNVRILPVRVDEPPESRRKIVARAYSRIGEGYGWEAVQRKFIAIILGRDCLYFRWRFFIDAALSLALVDTLLWPWLHRVVFLWLAAAYLLIIAVNLIRWKFDPLPNDHTYANPQDLLSVFKAQRGKRIVDAEALTRQAEQRKCSATNFSR